MQLDIRYIALSRSDQFEVDGYRGQRYNRLLALGESTGNEDCGSQSAGGRNDDGRVNIFDLTLVAQLMGNEQLFDPKADVNNDEVIDILDLVFIANQL